VRGICPGGLLHLALISRWIGADCLIALVFAKQDKQYSEKKEDVDAEVS
jgi:hypothetical protein